MTEETARSILRLIAVVTMLVGAILTTTAIIGLIGLSSSMRGAGLGLQVEASGMVAEMGFWAVFSYLLVASWGFALWLASPAIAQKVVA